MSGYLEVPLWCQEDKLRALSAALEPMGSSVEKEMNQALAELYEQIVPSAERAAISEKLSREERLEAEERARQAMRAHRVSAIQLLYGGAYDYLKPTQPWDILALAAFLREALRQSDRPAADYFRSKLGETEEISEISFDELTTARFQNSLHVNGVFVVDFMSQRFAFVMPGDAWRVYPFKDISTAIFRADQKRYVSPLERSRRFFAALEGRPYHEHPVNTGEV